MADDDRKKDAPPGGAERRQEAWKEFVEEHDRRLKACFDSPDFGERVDAMMDANGRTKVRPKAGETF